MKKLAVVVMWMICCGAGADWFEHEVQGVKLHQMTRKHFNLTYCGKRAYTGRRYLAPMPTCNDVQTSHVQRLEPLEITFWARMVVNRAFKAVNCRGVKVTTKTFENFFGEKKESRDHVWVSADKETCEEILSGKKARAIEQTFAGATQYGEIRTIYTYLKTKTTESVIHKVTNTTGELDLNLGKIYGPDGENHQCNYNEGRCDLKKGGWLMWNIEKEIEKDEGCPFKPRYSETCVAGATKDAENVYLVVTCPQTKIKLGT